MAIDWADIVPSLIGGGIGASIVAAFVADRLAKRAWLRDNKLRVYSEVAAAISDTAQAVQSAAERSDDANRFKEAFYNYSGILDRLRLAEQASELLSKPNTAQLLGDLREFTDKITIEYFNPEKREILWPKPEVAAKTEDWEPRKTLHEIAEKALDAMKKEIRS